MEVARSSPCQYAGLGVRRGDRRGFDITFGLGAVFWRGALNLGCAGNCRVVDKQFRRRRSGLLTTWDAVNHNFTIIPESNAEAREQRVPGVVLNRQRKVGRKLVNRHKFPGTDACSAVDVQRSASATTRVSAMLWFAAIFARFRAALVFLKRTNACLISNCIAGVAIDCAQDK